MYQEEIEQSDYPKEFLSHFPKQLLNNPYSFGGVLPASSSATHYWGLELFVNYNNETEKEYYLKNAKKYFKDTLIFNDNNLIFLNDISDYCDSINSGEQYDVYPYPNIQKFINTQSFIQNEEIVHSTDWKDYTYYVIERKNMVLYEEQGLNKCPLMEEKIDHGFSRGVVVNEKDKFIFFWLYFW